MRKLEVFLPTFCERCGRDRIVVLMPMYRGFAWYCFPCQLKYMLQTFGRRHMIAERLKQARTREDVVEETEA